MEIGREAILKLYRNLLKETKKWNSYNYRYFSKTCFVYFSKTR